MLQNISLVTIIHKKIHRNCEIKKPKFFLYYTEINIVKVCYAVIDRTFLWLNPWIFLFWYGETRQRTFLAFRSFTFSNILVLLYILASIFFLSSYPSGLSIYILSLKTRIYDPLYLFLYVLPCSWLKYKIKGNWFLSLKYFPQCRHTVGVKSKFHSTMYMTCISMYFSFHIYFSTLTCLF